MKNAVLFIAFMLFYTPSILKININCILNYLSLDEETKSDKDIKIRRRMRFYLITLPICSIVIPICILFL